MSNPESILVHICCSVDSHYFLQKLQKEYPASKLIGFFYDPNIHPYSEYYLRLLDVKRSCRSLGFELIEGDYDYESWLEVVRGLEDEPEKGARCSVCFDRRFEVSAIKAKEVGVDAFTSTLLTSPKKSIKQLKQSGEKLANELGLKFLAPDFRQKNGTQEQNIIAKEARLYRQNYCGCLYGLIPQREQQNRILDELFSPISKQIQPASIEDRVAMYEKREELEECGIDYKIVKRRFLNWRLKYAIVKEKKKTIDTHILPYSTIKTGYSRGKIEYEIDNIYHFSRDEIKFITLSYYNTLLNKSYKSVKELIFNTPNFNEEVELRSNLSLDSYDLSAIIVVDKIPEGKVELKIDSRVYEDVQEVLITL